MAEPWLDELGVWPDTSGLTEFRVTFGMKYARAGHPVMREVHPEGWLTVYAEDRSAVAAAMSEHFDNAYAFTYTVDRFDEAFHPRGPFARMAVLARGIRIELVDDLPDWPALARAVVDDDTATLRRIAGLPAGGGDV